MDSNVRNNDLIRRSSVADPTQDNCFKFSNFDMQCYLTDRTERKRNLYTKRTASETKRYFQKMAKRTSPLVSPTIDDCFSEISSLRAELTRAKDDMELGLSCKYMDSDEKPRKCVTPAPGGYIRNMVERFDSEPQALNRIQFKAVGKTSEEGVQNITKNCADSFQSTENTCLAFSWKETENVSRRSRSKSENVTGNTGKPVHHSRSAKPVTPPKPTSYLKSKLRVVNCQAGDLESNDSALTESKAVRNCCKEIANNCDFVNMDSSTTDASTLTNSNSLLSSDDTNKIPGATGLSDRDARKIPERTCGDDFVGAVGVLSTTVTKIDNLSGANRLGCGLEADDSEWEDIEASESIKKQAQKKKSRYAARRQLSNSSVKQLALKKSLSQKVKRVPSSREGPNHVKKIYVNETESEKDQASLLVSGVARDAEPNQVFVGRMRDSPEAEGFISAVSEQQSPTTNDSDPSDVSGSVPSHRLTRSDSDELVYEILPYRFSQECVVSSSGIEPIYEISSIVSSMLEDSEASTAQMVPSDASSVQSVDVSANVPQIPARPILHPDVPSPQPSPTPVPRKTSKGHIDVSRLTQVVLPPSIVPSLSNGSAPTPSVTIPRVPPRLGTSQSTHMPSTQVPLVLPRKRSDAQTVNHTKSRRLPPPPMPPPVPESSVYDDRRTDVPDEPPDVPSLPMRGIRHQSSADRYASGRNGGRRPSGTLRGYEAKCVEVDSGKPPRLNSKSTLSNTSSHSMSDLLKTVDNRGSTLSLHVPPPSAYDIEGNNWVSPSRSEGYLKQDSDGYLPMGSQRSSILSQFSLASESLEQNIPAISDGVPVVPPRHTLYRVSQAQDTSETGTHNLEKIVWRDNSYLDLTPDEDYSKYAYLSLYAESEPYQIYHQTAVVRQVIEQNMDTESDYDSYYSPQEYYEHAKLCVDDILKRDSGNERTLDSRKVVKSLTTLESMARLGTGFRKLWCEMPKVKDSGLLDHMTMEERRLQESLFEILSSEASYLKSLNLLVGHFMGMLAIDMDKDKQPVLTKQDFNWLFSNARAVRDACIKMLEALDNLWQDGCVLNPLRLCSTMTDVVQEHYGVYVTYCSNASYQERKLRQLNEKSAEFRYAVRRLEDSADCHSLPLHSFLALPMQRITRMPLLITTLCRYLKPDDASSPEVTRCIQTLQKVVKQCNEGARKMSNLEQMNNIEKVLDFRSARKVPLISQSRFLVKKGFLLHVTNQPSGFLKKSKRTLFFFLFNDLLIITKKKSEKQFEVLEHCSRSRILTEPITDENMAKFLPYGAPGGCRNLFNMVLIDKGVEFVLSCESQSEQQRWIQAVTPVEHTAGEEVIYTDWDCPQVQAVMQYIATEPDELSLEESDIVNVLRKENDGWYEGERIRDGERGWFPAHVTVEIQNEHVRARNLRQQYQLLKKSTNSFSVSG